MNDTPVKPTWIAVDWGTSNLRAWAMDSGGSALAEASSDQGMGQLAPEAFEPALMALIAPWLHGPGPMQVVACGMVGARQGWIEAPYATVPCPPTAPNPVRAPTRDPRIRVHVLPGLKQPRPADVMRGEETQVAGFLNPKFDGVICLPGSHSKWVQVSAGEVVSFRTAMTGELFAALAEHSVLRHSVTSDDWDADAFASALSDTMSRPETLALGFFGLRAEALLNDLPPAAARARLSGLLIGAELAATRAYWLGQQIALIGAPALCRLYHAALGAQGLSPIQTRGDAMTRAGLAAARNALKETQA